MSGAWGAPVALRISRHWRRGLLWLGCCCALGTALAHERSLRLTRTLAPAGALQPLAGPALALRDAVQEGLERNPGVRAVMARLDKSGTEVEIARAGYQPNVQAGVGTSGSGNARLGYDVVVSQMLYDWGGVESQVDSARAGQRRAAQELLVAREDAALDISESYLDVLFARQRVAAAARFIERLQELLALSERRVASGYVDRSESGRVTLALARAQEQLLLEQGREQEAMQQYALLVGAPAAGLRLPPLQPLTRVLAQGRHLDTLVPVAPLYLQALEKSRLEEANIKAADAALKPQLNLEGAVQRREIGGQLTRDATLMLRLRMAAFQGTANFRRVDAARQALEAAQWDTEQVERDIRRKVQALMEGEAPLPAREAALRQQIQGSVDIGGIYREQFFVGMRSMVDLLAVESDRFEAERQLLQLQSDRHRLPLRGVAQLGLLVPLLEGRMAEKILP